MDGEQLRPEIEAYTQKLAEARRIRNYFQLERVKK